MYKSFYKEIFNKLSSIDKIKYSKILNLIKKNKGTIYLAGNGASSSIADHVSVDFTKTLKIKSKTFNNSNLITCYSNDYGYENWISKAISSYCSNNDLVILISSSGKSKNICEAAKYCKQNKIKLITLSGFKKNNPLSKMGDLNIHVNSKNYNVVEIAHLSILLWVVEKLKN